MANNYVRGAGEIWFDRFATGTDTRTGERYLGNTPNFALTIEVENLDHFSSDGGFREKDASVVLETTRTGTLSCDNINEENVALFFFGTASNLTQTAISSDATETIMMARGLQFPIGVTAGRPTGLRNVTVSSIATISPSATAVVDVDYTVDAQRGLIYILPDSPFFSVAKSCVVTYQAAASTRTQVISGVRPIEGAMRFISKNPAGAQADFYMPKVALSPSGEYALKGEDWQVMEFTLEVLKPADREAIYRDGLPVLG